MRPWRRRCVGLTLIEVLVSLVLLGTLVGGMVLAKSRLTRQSVSAHERLKAVAAADALLIQWVDLDGRVPCPDRGRIEGWRWETVFLPDDDLADLKHRRVRLTLRSTDNGLLDSGTQGEPACVVDLVVPAETEGGGA